MSGVSAISADTLQNGATGTGNGTPLKVVGYNTVVFNVIISASATVTFEGTVDNSNWVSIQASSTVDGTTATTATSSGLYRAAISGLQYVRARVSTFGSGTITVTAMATVGGGSGGASGGGTGSNASQVQGNIAAAATDSGNPVKVGGKYNSSAPTYTDGQRGDIQIDANGNIKTTDATLIAGEDLTANVLKTEQRFSYSAVATADVAVKSSAGFLHSVTISCNDAAPTAGSLIIYDNTAESGTQVFNHTFTTTPFVPFTVILDYTMATGIYLGFTTTADVNVSVAYR